MTLNKKLLSNIIEWDVNNWSKCLSFWPKNSSLPLDDSHVLELGSRHGGLSLWAALNGAKVICSDLSGPTQAAIKKHSSYNVSNVIEYESIDALTIPYKNKFDIVISKSVIGGIGRNNNIKNQRLMIEEVFNSLKDGGEYWFIENLIASPIHRMTRNTLTGWGNTWRYISIDESKDFFRDFSSFNYKTFGFLSCFGPNELSRKIFSYFDEYLFNHITPNHWHYIIVGVAKK
ncbi:Complete genome; segment 17/17 [Xenorhabdus nematophila ATCC 19061]|uniref:Complete genome segment 17/17 n=1 Tax=Xenorhabdus nematophila (strain ATCC 19061 / DSM 3370 / CCUG 14189 / LMG 1036 / NCIMB 9965 / AN6) TaxID=406817 RepID=D3VKK8_XENNA|nr:class I SAM-dependent methyltransferase [Xenorhabdus nematophila]CBJ91116.1 Complete genome; segment 17/17 [Xenorhabdus nematophila ATCC 19061]CEK23938.1 Complete genome; segment 17/17 [Xenorhabdus nematophila AN6/1]